QIRSGQMGHEQVEDDGVEPLRSQKIKCLAAVGFRDNIDEALKFKERGDRLERIEFIVNNQQASLFSCCHCSPLLWYVRIAWIIWMVTPAGVPKRLNRTRPRS